MSASSKRWLTLVHQLPCVVCKERHGISVPCEEAHHLESVRGEHSDFATVPLCAMHHRQLHRESRRAFYLAHKLDDVKLLAFTAREVERLLWDTGIRLKAAT
jgi:hypothetical protein